MKIVYVSDLISKKKNEKIINTLNYVPLQSIQKYSRLLCEGFKENNYNVDVISSIPVSSKVCSKKIWYEKCEIENGIKYRYLPFVNMKIIRQLCFALSIFIILLKEILFDKEEKVFICDILNTTITFFTRIITKFFRIRCYGLVTDLPKDMNSNLLSKKINIFLQSKFDGYILLTEQMNDIINRRKKPFIVIEGICEKNSNYSDKRNNSKKIIMYAGGLYEKYGVKDLIDAVTELNDDEVELHLYGSGELEEYINKIHNKKIKFFGSVSNDVIIEKENEATLLVNPRYTSGEYTKYSFPSKNIEYMASGTPLLTTKLAGIPDEYFNYSFTIDKENKEGIKKKISEILGKNEKELKKIGQKAMEFVTKNKSKQTQTKKINKLLQESAPKNVKDLINKKTFQIYLTFLMIFIIYCSRNTLYTSLYLGFNRSFFLMLLLSVPLLYEFVINIKRFDYSRNRAINIFLTLDIMLILLTTIKGDFSKFNYTTLISVNLALIYALFVKADSFVKSFIGITAFLSITSLINLYIIKDFILNSNYNDLYNSILFIKNSAGTSFMNMITSFVVWIPGYIRNFSIFTEPAFFQFYLIFSIMLLTFSKYKLVYKIIGNILFSVTILSTLSTGGIITLLVFWLFMGGQYFIKGSRKDKIKIIFFSAVILIIISILICTNASIKENIIRAIKKAFTINDSSIARYGSIIYSLKTFIKNPILGYDATIFMNKMNITNTLFSIFSIFGILFGSAFTILLINVSKKICNSKVHWILVFIIILLSTTNHFFVGVQSFWFSIIPCLLLKEDSK